MRTASVHLLFCLLAATFFACEPPPAERIELKRLGVACEEGDECGSGLCLHGACTRHCASQGECPEGLDCGLRAAEDEEATCYVPSYVDAEEGGFGTSCSAFAMECGMGSDPCGEGFFCYGREACDPLAICTRDCLDDQGCPSDMFCALIGDERRVCRPRLSCTPCVNEDQCPGDLVCARSASGERFCSKPCLVAGDCLKPQKDFQTGQTLYKPFEACLMDESDPSRRTCQPVHGRCFGESTIEGQGEGGLCSGCRSGFDDCAEGFGCYSSPAGERFCSRECSFTLVAAEEGGYEVSEDDCPEGAACLAYVPQECPPEGCTGTSICTADLSRKGLSCFP